MMGAMQKILNGERPRRPDRSDFTDSLWELTQRCWSKEPRDRPGTREVIEVLKELSVFDSSSERRISLTHVATEAPTTLLKPRLHHLGSCLQCRRAFRQSFHLGRVPVTLLLGWARAKLRCRRACQLFVRYSNGNCLAHTLSQTQRPGC